MSLTIFINNDSYKSIKKGKKRIEGRLKKGRFKALTLKKNDIITFRCIEDSCRVKILDILEYNNILEYLNKEDLNSIIPGIRSVDIAYKHYNRFYSISKLSNYKMIAIRFNLIN